MESNLLSPLPKSIIQYGSVEPLPFQQKLRAGSVELLYENGFLRYLQVDGQEVVRMIYFALRDQNWGTFTPIFSGERADIQSDSFKIQYTCHYEQEGQPLFQWDVEIAGQADGTIHFAIAGEALQSFLKNRAGFCVLHPVKECAGKPVAITESCGNVIHTVFPALISPHRPFPYLKAMQWEINPGCTARLQFEGEVFETEDHRNWTDTSYKTFCTPLEIPFPVELKQGEQVRQSITLSFEGLPPTQAKPDNAIEITLSEYPEKKYSLPAIGVCQVTSPLPLSEWEANLLRSFQLEHYRVELDLSSTDWRLQYANAVAESEVLSLPWEMALIFSENAASEIAAFLREAHQLPCRVKSIMLLSKNNPVTHPNLIAAAGEVLRREFPGCLLGGGTRYNFAEFNRNHFPAEALDFVSYAIQPQEHAFDNLSLVENLQSQADTVVSAKAIYPKARVHVSPVSLRKRFNPYAKEVASRNVPLPLTVQADPRQLSLFAAGWTLGSLRYLVEGRVSSITYYQSHGLLGLMMGPGKETVIPGWGIGKIPVAGLVFPLYWVFRWVQEFAGGEIIASDSSEKLAVSSLVLEKSGQKRWIVANHRPEETIFQIPIKGQTARLRLLDETTALEAMQSPEAFANQPGTAVSAYQGFVQLCLLPYAVAMLDTE